MKKNLPKFTARASLNKIDNQCRFTIAPDDFIDEQGMIVHAALNRWNDDEGCWHFDGDCTGVWPFNKRQCVLAPDSQQPDASIVQQCCAQGFHFPWIKVCYDSYTAGCDFCVW